MKNTNDNVAENINAKINAQVDANKETPAWRVKLGEEINKTGNSAVSLGRAIMESMPHVINDKDDMFATAIHNYALLYINQEGSHPVYGSFTDRDNRQAWLEAGIKWIAPSALEKVIQGIDDYGTDKDNHSWSEAQYEDAKLRVKAGQQAFRRFIKVASLLIKAKASGVVAKSGGRLQVTYDGKPNSKGEIESETNTFNIASLIREMEKVTATASETAVKSPTVDKASLVTLLDAVEAKLSMMDSISEKDGLRETAWRVSQRIEALIASSVDSEESMDDGEAKGSDYSEEEIGLLADAFTKMS